MRFSLSEYKTRTRNLSVFSRGDANGLYLSWPEQWLFTRVSRFWRTFYRPRMNRPDTAKPLLAIPASLQSEHVADCRVFANRYALIASLEPGQVWAEVGTFEGAFARQILDTCKPCELHLIDRDFSHVRKAGHIQESDRVSFCEGDSAACLSRFPDAFFDCIYIDAGHDLSAVARDVDAARPKLKAAGLLIFNDYIVYSHIDQLPYGIVPVVNSLCNEDGWTVVALALHYAMHCDVALRRS